MSCRLPSLTFLLLLLLFLLRVQSIDLTRTRFLPAASDFEFPEIDGSAVDDACRVFPVPTPSPSPTRTTTTAKPPPVTKKVVITTKKPEVRTPPKKPETKDRGAPVRPQPAPAGPIPDNRPNPAVRLLHLLLTNSRRRAAGSRPGFIRLTSDSDELAAVLPRRTFRNRWNVGLFPSSDSSDES